MFEILLVDDDEVNSKIFSKRLQKKGYKVHQVFSGKECLEFIETNKNVIILLDIVMPEMNGVEVLDCIRKKYKANDLAVIMISAKGETEQVVECLDLGANDYIIKPVNMDIATARIEMQFHLFDLHRNSMKSKQLETVNSMVATYNHEINNPLTIALGCLKKKPDELSEKKLELAINSLNRIADIVKKIESITMSAIEEETYVEETKMIKLN